MECEVCGRTLQEDARYCDFCGAKVDRIEEPKGSLDKKLLLTGIAVSLGLTIILFFILKGLGLPIFIGGLFLPFFFKRKKTPTP